MPSIRRRFAPPRRRRGGAPPQSDVAAVPTLETELQVQTTAEVFGEPTAVTNPSVLWRGQAGLRQIAQLLWLPTYDKLFELEVALNEEACMGGGYVLPPSSYRARLSGERAEAYDQRRQQQRRDEMAIALHANNQWRWSPSLVARSVVYYDKTTEFLHAEETRQRRLASRPVCLDVLRMMRDCRPEPPWERARHVCVFGADQTYEWVGMQKHGRRRTLERHDASGMPIVIEHAVYVNSVKVHLPASLGNLSDEDRARIAANHGSPYTEDYANVFAPLAPETVKESLLELAADALQPIVAMVKESGAGPAQLTLREIAHGLFGRGKSDPGGPTEFDVLEPLEDTNTMSYEDFVRITEHLSKHTSADTVVKLLWADGQTVILAKNGKRRWPCAYASWLIGVGGFHEHAHSMFAFTETFDACFFRFGLNVLQIERVMPVTNNLEHNAYGHHQCAHHVTTIASVAFLVQDVRQPPPELLLRHGLDVYLSHIHCAGGIVMVEYLRGAGFPTLQWQRAARDTKGGKLRQLFAYSFHVYRSTCHKPVAAQIALIALLGFECTLPSLQAVLMATCSMSMLGRLSASMYADRLLEFINNLQQGKKRNASASSFGHALDLTTLLRTMLHVRHAFEATEHGAMQSDDPITESMLVQARLLQNEYRRLLGIDLTVPNAKNPFFHTGQPVALDGGDYRWYKPWEWIWRTAEGRSAGKGRRVERWDRYVRRFVYEHMFRY